MEAITLYLPSRLVAIVRTSAMKRGQKLPEFILSELQRSLHRASDVSRKRTNASSHAESNWGELSDESLMQLANARMQRSQALQMHRLIHLAGARKLSGEENKLLDTLLEIHNEVGIKKAQAISEAIRRGLLPPLSDQYWSSPSRRKFYPRKRR